MPTSVIPATVPQPSSAATASATPLALRPGDSLGARYEILQLLGQGGMGSVYKAHDRTLDRTVAVKVIRPDLALRADVFERFKREILLASRVTHRNVVRIHDLGEADGIAFISMNFVDGQDLKSILQREGPLPADRALPIFRQVTAALEAAHAAGVVHRDLKPQNVLVDGNGEAYIADFGISRLEGGAGLTETGMVIGTVDYMSPEQARGEAPDYRSDLYSLGMIFYETLTGALPFQGGNAMSVLLKRVHENAPAVKSIRPGIPPWLSVLVARALERDPALRYQSATDILSDLDAHRAHRSRKRLLLRVGAVLAAATAVALVGTWIVRARSGVTAAPRPTPSLLVLPFHNETGDPRFDWAEAGLASLTRSALNQSRALRVVEENRGAEVLAAFTRGGSSALRPQDVQRAVVLLDAGNVLRVRLLKAGDTFRLEATLQRRTGETLSPGTNVRVEGRGETALFPLVDELAQRIAAELGAVRDVGTGARDMTASAEALALYSESKSLRRAGLYNEAARKLEQALATDRRFAAAAASLAEVYEELGQTRKAIEVADAALSDLRQPDGIDANRLRGLRFRLAGEYGKAAQAYRAVADALPNSPEALVTLASAQEQQGELPQALLSLTRALELDPKNPGAHADCGRLLVKLARPEEALVRFKAARDLYRDIGNDTGLAGANNGLGMVHAFSLGKPDEALRYFEEAAEAYRRLGNEGGVAATLNNVAAVRMNQGRYDESIRVSTEARAIWTRLGNASGLATCLSNLGEANDLAGRRAEAIASYKAGLEAADRAGDTGLVARISNSLGASYAAAGNFVDALFWQKQALAKRRDLRDNREIIVSLIDTGLVEHYLGRFEEAARHYLEGLSLARAADDGVATLSLLLNSALLRDETGDYGAVFPALDEAEKLAHAVKRDDWIPLVLAYRGHVLQDVGNVDGAERALGEAERLARTAPGGGNLAEVLIYRAALAGARDDPRAAALRAEARATAERQQDFRLTLMARLELGRAERSPREIEDVLRTVSGSGLLSLEARSRLALADVRLAMGHPSDARREAESAAEVAARIGQRRESWTANAMAAGIALKQGQAAAAADHCAAALPAFAALRQGLDKTNDSYFLMQPATTSFATTAREAFLATGRTGDAKRLEEIIPSAK